MKRRIHIALLGLFCALCLPAGAQHYLGVRGGYGNGTIRFYPPAETGAVWGRYNFGISYKYYSPEKYLGGVEVDLQYIQKGYAEPQAAMPDTVRYHRVNSIEMPLFWQPHLYVMGRQLRVFLNAGVVFSYNLNASDQTISKRDGVLIPEAAYNMILVRDNRWGYGLCAGAGVNYILGHVELMAEARYSFGYSDIYKNRNKYYDNFYLRSPMDNLYFCVGAYWRFGKGGILAPPSKKVAAKMAEREAERAARRPKNPPKPAAEPETSEPAQPETQAPAPETPTTEQTPQPDGNHTPAQSSPTDTEGHQ